MAATSVSKENPCMHTQCSLLGTLNAEVQPVWSSRLKLNWNEENLKLDTAAEVTTISDETYWYTTMHQMVKLKTAGAAAALFQWE